VDGVKKQPELVDLGGNNWRLSGDLSFVTVAGLVDMPDFGDQRRGIICVDLAGVTRAESAGLALLLEWQRVAEEQGLSIAYVNMPVQMQSMAAVCGLEEILQSA
jgi:phospholipid transport system transporter-binding protein